MTTTQHISRFRAAPPELSELATEQDGVLTRRQLFTGGVTADAVAASIAARRSQAVGRRAVVLHNAELTVDQRRWAAVLMLDQPTALAAVTAAQDAGLVGFDDHRVHVVVRRSCSADMPSWVVVHNSRRFSAADIDPGTRRPRTRISRSLIDLAAWSSTPRRACAALCAGVQQRLVRANGLTAELKTAGHLNHAAIMRAVLGDIGGGGHTLAELDLGPLAAMAGLPAPRRQVLRREPDGKVRYVDAEIDLPDGEVLVVEIDGAVHLRPLTWWDDLDRQNEISIAGNPILRFGSATMRLDPSRVIDQLRRMAVAHSGPTGRVVTASPVWDPWKR